jgi:hypothetical protein
MEKHQRDTLFIVDGKSCRKCSVCWKTILMNGESYIETIFHVKGEVLNRQFFACDKCKLCVPAEGVLLRCLRCDKEFPCRRPSATPIRHCKSRENDFIYRCLFICCGPKCSRRYGKAVEKELAEGRGATKPYVCAYCRKPSEKKCSGCKLASYCSEECQANDWPGHKEYCKTTQTSRKACYG